MKAKKIRRPEKKLTLHYKKKEHKGEVHQLYNEEIEDNLSYFEGDVNHFPMKAPSGNYKEYHHS